MLPISEWLILAALAAVLAITNTYTTLLTGWSDGGSLIAVVAALGVARALGRGLSIRSLNLAQTMASAGGAVGFAVAAYAAIRMADSGFHAGPLELAALFGSTAIGGVLLAAELRGRMVRYPFPSGTACAVLQKTAARGDSRRDLLLLGLSGLIAAAWTVPTKVALTAGGAPLLSLLGSGRFGLSLEPLYYALGLVIGVRIAAGLLLGSLAAAFIVPAAVPAAELDAWIPWLAIAALTAPTLVAIAAARWLGERPPPPAGFEPDDGPRAGRLNLRARRLGLLACAAVATLAAYLAFDVSIGFALIAIGACLPLALVNGRVTADTDINPVVIVVLLLVSGFALAGEPSAVALLGLGLIGSTAISLAVDTMQDHRTGYLLAQNPHHQTVVQVVGVLVGVAVSVPFLLMLDDRLGFGAGGMPAPGPRIYTAIAGAVSADGALPSNLWPAVILVSVGASIPAVLSTWPRTAAYTPSIFGVGIGLLLPLPTCLAIFVGALAGWVVVARSARSHRDRRRRDIAVVGSSGFAASAVIAALLLALSYALAALGLAPFSFAG